MTASAAAWFLLRHCSSSTEPNILLGVFENQERAESAKRLYINTVSEYGDVHKNQSGWRVNLQQDIHTSFVPVASFLPDHPILVLVGRLDAMGEILQGVEMFTCDMAVLCEHGKRRETQELDQSSSDEFFYDSIMLNELRFENHSVPVTFIDECDNIEQLKSHWTLRYYQELKRKLCDWIQQIKEGPNNEKHNRVLQLVSEIAPLAFLEQLYSKVRNAIYAARASAALTPFRKLLSDVINEVYMDEKHTKACCSSTLSEFLITDLIYLVMEYREEFQMERIRPELIL